MKWGYRICRAPDGVYSLREVYGQVVDGVLKPDCWTDAIDFGGYESQAELCAALAMALKDAERHPVLEVPE